jgi:hypothetical protein
MCPYCRKAIAIGMATCICVHAFAHPRDLHTHTDGPVGLPPGQIDVAQLPTGPTGPYGLAV